MSFTNIAIALTHFNRFDFLVESIKQVQDDPRIGEIVISDDASTDGSWEKIQAHYGSNPKFRLFRNEENLDCYRNKAKAVERTQSPWLILFDSDNVLSPAYLDRLYNLPAWTEDTFYCPDFAEPMFDYREWGGVVVTRENVAKFMGKPTLQKRFQPIPGRRDGRGRPYYVTGLPNSSAMFRTALNTCNFFIPRDSYLRVWDGSLDPHTADTLFQNYNWLVAGGRLAIVQGLRYFHRVHPQSHFKNNWQKTGNLNQQLEKKLLELT